MRRTAFVHPHFRNDGPKEDTRDKKEYKIHQRLQRCICPITDFDSEMKCHEKIWEQCYDFTNICVMLEDAHYFIHCYWMDERASQTRY